MKKTHRYIKQSLFFILLGVVFISSCAKQAKSDTEVYHNDFESGDLSKITSGTIEVYNGSHVLGRYNKGGFIVNLSNLPKHDAIKISFDLYIHDSWDGNATYADGGFGPDFWKMLVDGQTVINTTFSNYNCPAGLFCQPQSYPQNYPSTNNSKEGAYRTDLPAVCTQQTDFKATSQYKIQKTITHSGSSFKLECMDQLIDKFDQDQKCSESWSVDNLVIKAVSL